MIFNGANIVGSLQREAVREIIKNLLSNYVRKPIPLKEEPGSHSDFTARHAAQVLEFVRMEGIPETRISMVLTNWEELYRCSRIWAKGFAAVNLDLWEIADEIIRNSKRAGNLYHIKNPAHSMNSVREMVSRLSLPTDVAVIETLAGNIPVGLRGWLEDLRIMQLSMRAGFSPKEAQELLKRGVKDFKPTLKILLSPGDLEGINREVEKSKHLGDFFWLGRSVDDEIVYMVGELEKKLESIQDSLEPGNCLARVCSGILECFYFKGEEDSCKHPFLREVFLAGMDTLIVQGGMSDKPVKLTVHERKMLSDFQKKMVFSRMVWFPKVTEASDAKLMVEALCLDWACMLKNPTGFSDHFNPIFRRIGDLRSRKGCEALLMLKNFWKDAFRDIRTLIPDRSWDMNMIHFLKRCHWLDERLQEGDVEISRPTEADPLNQQYTDTFVIFA